MEQKRMMAVQCKICGNTYYPPRKRCPNCRSIDLVETQLRDVCTLVTYTKLFAVPNGIEEMPLVIGMVEFANGVRALGQIKPENIEVGAKLQPVWGLLRRIQGREIYGFKFVSKQ